MSKTEQCSCQHDGALRVVGMVFGIILVIALAAYVGLLARNKAKEYNYIGKTPETISQVTISGLGKIIAVPDIAKLTVGVWTSNKNVATAQKENTERMNKVIAALTKLGVADKDLKTQSYNIYPQYDWINNVSTFKDYRVEQNLDIKIRDTEKISAILEAVGSLKADYIGQLTFEVDKVEQLKQDAKVQAIKDAKSKAEELAKALGIKLGKVVNFYEADLTPAPYDYYRSDMKAIGAGMSAESAPAPAIKAGESEIISNVSITFELL